jgi:hypothetical protein
VSFFDFRLFFFVVVVLVLWSLLLAWCLASAGDTINRHNKHSPMIHVQLRLSLLMSFLSMRACGDAPGCWNHGRSGLIRGSSLGRLKVVPDVRGQP